MILVPDPERVGPTWHEQGEKGGPRGSEMCCHRSKNTLAVFMPQEGKPRAVN